MRLLAQDARGVKVEFSRFWWKHLPPPTTYQATTLFRSLAPKGLNVPKAKFIVMVREPVSHLRSLHRFWLARRKMLAVPVSFSTFIRSEFIVHDTSFGATGPKYWYASPIHYWIHFYFAYLTWSIHNPEIVFCRLEDLTSEPDATLSGIFGKPTGGIMMQVNSAVLARPVSPGRDGRPASVRAGEFINPPDATTPEDREFIASQIPGLLKSELRY
jgi:hypothetical protein